MPGPSSKSSAPVVGRSSRQRNPSAPYDLGPGIRRGERFWGGRAEGLEPGAGQFAPGLAGQLGAAQGRGAEHLQVDVVRAGGDVRVDAVFDLIKAAPGEEGVAQL